MAYDFVNTPIQEPFCCNALKLAEYLESLPEDYDHFDMSHYYDDGWATTKEAREWVRGQKRTCGTSACAAGHGPAAGFPIPDMYIPDEYNYDTGRTQKAWSSANWPGYAMATFVSDSPNEEDAEWAGHAYSWMFGGHWDGTDNHHWGAAARIRYLVEEGRVPRSGWGEPELYEKYRTKERIPLKRVPKPVQQKDMEPA